ncbi:hypothetical protein PR202_gn00101 [Eleusine coracana subsp. coracana]|uniref:Uncharacterized protein n=1 Tax=Eleusine coracana subsp. coracana TaxID=191504 RepID=A0AAV5FYN0_ELECO|nr:hypothetical protein PR202_gb20028 [Eleusine coracana subsp. coracana]GJN40798.1 hypothetical protein PR202_gn00101 [Eleusine coracana subsp. coracana]
MISLGLVFGWRLSLYAGLFGHIVMILYLTKLDTHHFFRLFSEGLTDCCFGHNYSMMKKQKRC